MADSPPQRNLSLDIARGAIMVLMAVDHVRVYSGQPAGGPTPGIFFTRWITHFCAPGFVFLAGSAAFLHGRKLGSRSALSRWLATRGLLLVLLELTLVRVSWTFNFDFARYNLGGVIWAIGLSMLTLAALVHLPVAAVGGLGIAVIALHNLLDFLSPATRAAIGKSALLPLWRIVYFGGPLWRGSGRFVVLYSLIPWAAVMAAGYAFGQVLVLPPERRRKICAVAGAAMTAAFVVLRLLHRYGDPDPWEGGFLAFLATTKYPASLLFLLMTLGPIIGVLPLLEHARGPVARALAVFGRVPLFFYLLHIPLIHAVSLLVSVMRTGAVSPWLLGNQPMVPPPPAPQVWSLPLLYAVWAAVVALLYFACRWYAGVKQRNPRSVALSYL